MSDSLGFVLIHGGYHGAWAWERLVPHLHHRALAVDLPGRGTRPASLDDVTLEAVARSVADDVAGSGLDRVVLVGHSLAGVSLPAIANQLDAEVVHLVFVASLVAADGRSSLASMPDELQERSAQRLRVGAGAASDIDPEHHREQLCNDMDDEQTEFTLSRLVPDSMHLFHEPVQWAGAATIAKTYVRLARDQALPPAMQDYMIALLGDETSVVELDTGHNVMISDPPLLAGVLDRIAAASG